MQIANSSNQSAILKENDDDKIQHYAEGGAVIPEGFEADTEALNQENPQSQMATQGLQQMAHSVFNSTPVQNMVTGQGLDAYQAMVNAAMNGDPQAQQALAEHNSGVATGSIKVIPNVSRPLGTVANDIRQIQPKGFGTVTNDIKQAVKPSGYGKVTVLEQNEPDLGSVNYERKPNTIIPTFADGGVIPEGFEADTQSQQSTPVSTSGGMPEGFEPEVDTMGGYAAAGARGLGEGIAGPLAPLAEQAFRTGVLNTPREQVQQEQLQSREQYPTTHMVGEISGLAGSMMGGVGLGSAAMHLGEGAAAHALPAASDALAMSAANMAGPALEAATPLAKIGSRAVSDMVANAAISGSDEVSKLIMGDPSQSAETAAANVGLGGLIGGVMGAGFGAVSPLWAATSSKASEALTSLADHLGGIEGQVPDAVSKITEKTGVDLAPELMKVVEGDRQSQQLATELLQTDAKSGKDFQEIWNKQHNDIADGMIGALGKDPSTVDAEVSKYEHGKNIGETLAKEYHEQVSPISQEFERLKSRFSDKELIPDTEVQGAPDYTNPYDPKPGEITRVPGTVSKAADEIAQLAHREGWMASPSSEIMTEVNRVIKELPKQKTLKDLSSYITAVGDNTASKLPFGQQTPLSRAGSMMKSILRDAESDVTIQRLGEKDGPEAVSAFKQARSEFAEQARKRDYLNDNLKSGGSVSNFAKGLREMSRTDGEAIANRLSGKGNADLLRFLEENYPKTAQAVKSMHVDTLVKAAADKATEGNKISIAALRSGLEKMSPELREFIASPEALTKIDALGQWVDKLEPKNYNHSNTARTLAKHLSDMVPSAAGLISMLTGHGAIQTGITAILGKYLTHEAPATMKLALLKFLASGAKVDAPAFKAMLESMNSMVKGETLLSKASKNVFKLDREVLPEALHPQERDRTKLQKQLDNIKKDPQSLLNAPNKAAHYMPEHGVSTTETIGRASAYLEALKPHTKTGNPLDTPIKPTTSEKAAYDNALNIAHQPLIVMNRVKAGTATPADMAALKAMYPGLYTRMASKLIADMTDAVSRGETIPYKTKLGLSQFLGQPMDSTMTPSHIIAAQPPTTPQPQQNAPSKPPSASSMKGMDKLPNAYMTQDQARARRSMKQ